MSAWTGDDQAGLVYGWPTEVVSLTVVHPSAGPTRLGKAPTPQTGHVPTNSRSLTSPGGRQRRREGRNPLVSLLPALSMADLAIFVRKVQLYCAHAKIEWNALEKSVLVPLVGVGTAVATQAASWAITLQAPTFGTTTAEPVPE